MIWPKPVMSITEVEKMGVANRVQILQWIHMPKARFAYRTKYGKKWHIDTEKFEEFLNEQTERN